MRLASIIVFLILLSPLVVACGCSAGKSQTNSSPATNASIPNPGTNATNMTLNAITGEPEIAVTPERIASVVSTISSAAGVSTEPALISEECPVTYECKLLCEGLGVDVYEVREGADVITQECKKYCELGNITTTRCSEEGRECPVFHACRVQCENENISVYEIANNVEKMTERCTASCEEGGIEPTKCLIQEPSYAVKVSETLYLPVKAVPVEAEAGGAVPSTTSRVIEATKTTSVDIRIEAEKEEPISIAPQAEGGAAVQVSVPVPSVSGVEVSVESAQETKLVKIEKVEDKLSISSGNVAASTVQPVLVKSGKVLIVTPQQAERPVEVLPDEVGGKIEEKIRHAEIKEMELKTIGEKATYIVKAEKKAKILWVMPVTMSVEAEVSAETGKVVKATQPWWSFLAVD